MFGCGVRFHFFGRCASAGSKRGTHDASSSRSDLAMVHRQTVFSRPPGQRILYAANRDQTQIQLQRSHQI